MSKFRFARTSLIVAALGLNFAPALLVGAHAADKAAAPAPEAPKPDTVRPELFKLLDPAQIKELMTAKNYAEVQNRLTQSEALPNLTPYESFVMNRMRVSLGSATSNNAMTISGLEAVLASGKLPPADQADFVQALGNLYYNTKDYPKAIATFNKYAELTGDTKKLRPYILRAYYFSNDFATAKAELLKDLDANVKAGKAPTLEELQLLANTGAKSKDTATYLVAVEKLVQYYPTDDYWVDLLSRTQGKATYSNRFALDVYRLQKAAVSKMAQEDYTEMAELALLAGQPIEAKKAVDAGYAAGVLGVGNNADKHKKLRAQADKQAADDTKNIASGEASAKKSKDGTGLVNLGYAYVTLEQFDKGIELIKEGIAKGGLKNPEDAKLRLGYSYAMAGKKDEAVKVLETVQGADGRADLARYWTLWVNRPVANAASASAAK
ncbi:hypothetical protein LJR289_003478 [Pseudoduganella sp. LjRoot289]|uniref:tetratricopeptide repeat protein n=1 Tax=Pseudoduganella sp. LjRoot289 TaxID=3342314 RepID=UPI003ECCF793